MGTADGTTTSIPEVRSDAGEHASNLLDDALLLIQEWSAVLHDQLCLVSNEAQLAARSLIAMVAAAVGIGVLLVSVWLGLMAAATLAVIGLGVPPAVAMLIGAALNLIALLVPYEMIRRKSRDLAFPATRRTLEPASRGGGSGGDARRAA